MDETAEDIPQPIVFVTKIWAPTKPSSKRFMWIEANPILRKTDIALMSNKTWNSERLSYSSYGVGEGHEGHEPPSPLFANPVQE